MAENVLRIKIESDDPNRGSGGTSGGVTRDNPDLDAFMGQKTPPTAQPKASDDIRYNPDLDAVFGIKTPPRATPKAPEVPSPDVNNPAPSNPVKQAIPLPDESGSANDLSSLLSSGNLQNIARIARVLGRGDISAAINATGRSGILGASEAAAGAAAGGAGGGGIGGAAGAAAAGGASGGAAGLASTVMASAGPIALGVIAAKLGADFIAGVHKGIQQDIERAKELNRAVLKDDPLAVMRIGAEKVADTFEKIPIVGKIYAEQIRTEIAAIGALNDVIAATAERGRELQAYSGAITRAVAEQEISKLRNDIRESQQLGGDYGRVISAQTRTEDAMREAILPIKESMVSLTADLSEKIADIAEIVKPGIQITGDIISLLVEYKDVLFPIFSSIELSLKTAKWLSSLLAGIREIFAKDDEVAQDALDQILKMADLNMPLNAKQEAANPPDDSLNIPIFN